MSGKGETMKQEIRKWITGAAIVATLLGWGYARENTDRQNQIQEDIAKEVIRLHVVANSDSEDDQKLKLEVKEKVVALLREKMKSDETVNQAEKTLRENLPQIEKIASDYIQKKGYDYEVKADVGKDFFPIKEYGDMTFPAGEYKALKVKIGKSQGKNWWCVMYPTLCFVDSTYQIVPEESKEKLKKTLTQEEYNSLLMGGENVHYGFKILDWIKGLGK